MDRALSKALRHEQVSRWRRNVVVPCDPDLVVCEVCHDVEDLEVDRLPADLRDGAIVRLHSTGPKFARLRSSVRANVEVRTHGVASVRA